MKRRQFIRYAQAGLLASLGAGLTSGWQASYAQSGDSLQVQWLGHTCFLFTGGGQRILVNPFRNLGCTAGYRSPKVAADLVMISSILLDEGAVEDLPGNPKLLYQSGAYQLGNQQIQGIQIAHDREGGRRFGQNVAWRWKQAGIDILHLGGAAAPISIEQQILMAGPDLLFLPVGGGPKAYTPEEAAQAMRAIKPKVVIPTHYLTQAADTVNCDVAPVEEFLSLVSEVPVRQVGADAITLSTADIPAGGPTILVFNYKF
jgi:L-ascorbate metabolism protein UlaG (beta-lactamase superfamily)